MKSIEARINALDWKTAGESMHKHGYALFENVLSAEECNGLISGYNKPEYYRKTISMERYRFGFGEYKYFNYPLPGIIQELREHIYPNLSPIANQWMKQLRTGVDYPGELEELLTMCKSHQQIKPTVLILKYKEGGHNTLHQDLYGEVFFPLQAVFFLTEPGKDYLGGEFVLIEQRPRAQSKAIVLKPGKGDLLIFTTNYRPAKGSKGFYRVNMKHGVSEVLKGERYTLGIIFHDAL